jgi:hypothetical protein
MSEKKNQSPFVRVSPYAADFGHFATTGKTLLSEVPVAVESMRFAIVENIENANIYGYVTTVSSGRRHERMVWVYWCGELWKGREVVLLEDQLRYYRIVGWINPVAFKKRLIVPNPSQVDQLKFSTVTYLKYSIDGSPRPSFYDTQREERRKTKRNIERMTDGEQ